MLKFNLIKYFILLDLKKNDFQAPCMKFISSFKFVSIENIIREYKI